MEFGKTAKDVIRKPGVRVAAGFLTVALAGCGAQGGGENNFPATGNTTAPSGSAGFGEGPATDPATQDPTAQPQARRTHHHPYTTAPVPDHTTTSAAPETITEYGDNTHGSPVFADEYGHPVTGGEPSRIPFDTGVEVVCKRPNLSTMGSVTAFYLIEGGPWDGDYVVADTMTNGGPRRDPSTPNEDPRVAECPPR